MRILPCLLVLLLAPLAGCHDAATVSTKDADAATLSGAQRTASADADWQSFGEPVSIELAQVAIADVLADPAAFAGRDVALYGTVAEVCQHAGCWLRLSDPFAEDETVFVKFTCPIDGERLIPLDAVGKPVMVQGTIVVEQIDEAEARHLAQEAGKSEQEITAIVGAQQIVRVDSPSARLRS